MDTIFLQKLKNSINFSKFDRVLLNLSSFQGFKQENSNEDSFIIRTNFEEICKYLQILMKLSKKVSVYFPNTVEIRDFVNIFESSLGENK